ncbi:hypothetical protein LZ554_008079 [Drepanopeziza brunnea f. sp. 'monogermtubi']|nr:hypothetical protein LZ554_008079 [Drepanopeziza brunnea f. sp. 'monogermtubi']
MASFQVLDSREEDELHKSRLLNVEEKPFKRITKRLLAPGSLLVTPSKPLTPPPESGSENNAQEAFRQHDLDLRRQFREDVEFDFAAFNYSISRIQFLLNSNECERERYKADKQRILDTAQAVRENTVQLRIQLEEAKASLEQRKKFDKHAEKITNNMLLKPRDVQADNLAKLEAGCEEERRESEQYGVIWRERRAQFEKIIKEGQSLRALIRDEADEVERKDGLKETEGDEGADDGASRGAVTPKHSENATPSVDELGQSSEAGLKPKSMTSGSLSRPGSRTTSRAQSPTGSERRVDAGDGEDANMTDSGSKADAADVADTPMTEAIESQMQVETPQVTIEEPAEDMAEAIEEGEAAEDKMDTT